MTIPFASADQLYFYMSVSISAEFLKLFLFELEDFSTDFKIDYILVWQLTAQEDGVVIKNI